MRTTRCLGVALLVSVIALSGCSNGTGATKSASQTPRDFTVDISGTQGLPVDLLVILKPDASPIVRVVDEQVRLPYKREFTGVGWAVWVDGEYRGQEGEYTLRIGGSSASGIVKEGTKDQSSLRNL